MSQGSRSKFDGVREMLLRFRRDYFCIRSSERRPDCAARRTRPDAEQLPPALSVGHGRGHDGGQPATTSDGRLSEVKERRLVRRHSVPSRCVSVLESLEEEDFEVATVDCIDCRPSSAEAQEVLDLMPAVSKFFDYHSSSPENDHDDYDAFVRGLQSTGATVATVIRPGRPSEGTTVPAGAVCRSVGRAVGVQSIETPCSVGRRTSEQTPRRSFGGRLIRTLRKTFSLGKNDDVMVDGEPTRPRSSLSTGLVDELESTEPTRTLDKHSDQAERQQLTVSNVNLIDDSGTYTQSPTFSRNRQYFIQ